MDHDHDPTNQDSRAPFPDNGPSQPSPRQRQRFWVEVPDLFRLRHEVARQLDGGNP